MTQAQIKELAEKIILGIASDEEILLYNRALDVLRSRSDEAQMVEDEAELAAAIKSAVFERAGLTPKPKVRWLKWTAAAAVLLALSIGGYTLFSSRPVNKPLAVLTDTTQRFKNDVPPGQEGAVLTLANGTTITLDSAGNGALAQQGTSQVIKKDGRLIYLNEGAAAEETVYNTMTTPRGRQYHLTLSDGTRVWLNAASSITYPAAFSGKSRQVRISGEVYFEVAHLDNMPFEVQKDDVQVRVLGTHFNINSYDDEPALKVTLLEGSVRVTDNRESRMLQPGQQAQVLSDKINVGTVDVEDVLSWKNGSFHFAGAKIDVLMRQLARWYDVDIEYHKKVEDLFYADIPRNTPLSDVLKALELTGKIRFRIEGKKIVVME